MKSFLKDAGGRIRLRFTPNVTRTVDHLLHYRWEPGSDKPCKEDGHDHAMDALRYLVVNLQSRRPASWSGAKVMGVGR